MAELSILYLARLLNPEVISINSNFHLMLSQKI